VEQFVTVTEAATLLHLSTRRVQQLIASGFLERVGQAGHVILLQRADVERLAREGWPGRKPPAAQ
jgi:excisionase family DNA binding protein